MFQMKTIKKKGKTSTLTRAINKLRSLQDMVNLILTFSRRIEKSTQDSI